MSQTYNDDFKFSIQIPNFLSEEKCDELKKDLLSKFDYVLDTNTLGEPKLATGNAIRSTLVKATSQPFSVVPYFDAGPWGGQWMKEKFDLDKTYSLPKDVKFF